MRDKKKKCRVCDIYTQNGLKRGEANEDLEDYRMMTKAVALSELSHRHLLTDAPHTVINWTDDHRNTLNKTLDYCRDNTSSHLNH